MIIINVPLNPKILINSWNLKYHFLEAYFGPHIDVFCLQKICSLPST